METSSGKNPRYPFQKLEWNYLKKAEQIQRSRKFLETMRTRRSVRHYSSREVPFEVIENAVQTAGFAPSGANQQPWSFIVVGDQKLKRKIREAAEKEERESYEKRMSAEWLEALEPLGTDWHKAHLEEAPYLIVVFEQVMGHAIAPDGSEHKFKHYYPKESVGISVGFLLAALHHSGLATLVHTPSPMKFLQTILNRPDNERAFAIIPVGYPAEDARVPVIGKKRLDEILIKRVS